MNRRTSDLHPQIFRGRSRSLQGKTPHKKWFKKNLNKNYSITEGKRSHQVQEIWPEHLRASEDLPAKKRKANPALPWRATSEFQAQERASRMRFRNLIKLSAFYVARPLALSLSVYLSLLSLSNFSLYSYIGNHEFQKEIRFGDE